MKGKVAYVFMSRPSLLLSPFTVSVSPQLEFVLACASLEFVYILVHWTLSLSAMEQQFNKI
jgi:hypothetical protein